MTTSRLNPNRYVAISTQCVGVGTGGSVSMLARVSVVDYRGQTIIDSYVAPIEPVIDYRTNTTGIEAAHFDDAIQFRQAQAMVADAIRSKIIVGYTLWGDLFVLGIAHPAADTRDVGLFLPFRHALHMPNQVVGLQTLVWQLMRRAIQVGAHDSVENARACMDLFRSHEAEWEGVITSGQWPCALPPSTYQRFFT